MQYPVYRIAELCEIKSGKRLPKNCDFSPYVTNFPYIRGRDIKNGKINTEDLLFIEEDVHLKIKKYIIETNDIALTIVGSVGDVGYATEAVNGFNLTENAVRLTNFKKNVYGKYLFYVLNQKQYYDYMQLIAGAAAQPKLGIYKIERIKVELPEISTQRRISSILSAYDDLIENNNRRIKILEKMAENLYKEWFVRFRFPGYEQAEFENGIPKGWETKRLGDELEVKRGGSPRPIHEYISDTGLKWLKISDATQSDNPYIVNIEESIIEEGLKKTVYLKAGSLVLSNSATPGLPRILTIDSCIHDGWLYFPKKKLSNEYLYLLFNHIRPHLLSKGNGAIFTNLKTDILKRYLFTKPTDIVLSLFNDLVKPIFGQIYSLTMKNQNLTKQRDMLLPRLMSGKLEV